MDNELSGPELTNVLFTDAEISRSGGIQELRATSKRCLPALTKVITSPQ